jgi:hypothetical protein
MCVHLAHCDLSLIDQYTYVVISCRIRLFRPPFRNLPHWVNSLTHLGYVIIGMISSTLIPKMTSDTLVPHVAALVPSQASSGQPITAIGTVVPAVNAMVLTTSPIRPATPSRQVEIVVTSTVSLPLPNLPIITSPVLESITSDNWEPSDTSNPIQQDQQPTLPDPASST